MCHLTCDTWHLISDKLGEVKILSQLQVSISYGLGVTALWKYVDKMNTELMTRVFVEQPGYTRSVNYKQFCEFGISSKVSIGATQCLWSWLILLSTLDTHIQTGYLKYPLHPAPPAHLDDI